MARETTLAEDVTRRQLLSQPDDTDDTDTSEQPVEEPETPPEPPEQPAEVEQPEVAQTSVEQPVAPPQGPANGGLWVPQQLQAQQPGAPQATGGEEQAPRGQVVATGPAQLPESSDNVEVTHYGYAGDEFWDENSGKGIGDNDNPLIPGYSVALSRSGRQTLLGIDSDKSTGQTFTYGGHQYRDDDTSPSHGPNLDVYDPLYQGKDSGVSDATVAARQKLSPPPSYDVKAQPVANLEGTGDTTGVANYFIKRGDDPITDSNDPRLTTVGVGNQKWQVNSEAAPYFQGFVNDLANAGAPVRSDGGWVYRTVAGTNTLSDHAYGGAIDISSDGRNQPTPEFAKWMQNNPGALEALENKWHIYGGERFGDLSHFEWGGVTGGGGAPAVTKGRQAQQPGQPAGIPTARAVVPELGSTDVLATPELLDAARAKEQQSDNDQMAQLVDKFKGQQSLPGLIRQLDTPIPDIDPRIQAQFQQQAKDELTAESQKAFNEPDPDKALAKGMSSAGPFEVGADLWHKIFANLQGYQAAATAGGSIPVWQFGKESTPYNMARNDINGFFAKAGMNDDQQHAFLAQIHDMSPEDREKAIAAVLPPQIPGVTTGSDQPSANPAYLARAFDKIFDPKFEQQQNQEITNLRGQIAQNLTTDPRLKGTGMETINKGTAFVVNTLVDGLAFASPATYPLLAAKVSDQMSQQVKQEHPDWTDAQVQRAATYGTLVAMLGQASALHAFNAVAEPLVSGIEGQVTRFLAKVGVGAAGGGATMAGGQALTNVLQSRPAGTGVLEAGLQGALLGAGGAALGGPGEYRPRAVEPEPTAPEPTTPVRPPVPEGVPEEEQVYPPRVPIPPVTREIAPEQVLGPEAEERVPWYTRDPIAARLMEGERVFTPSTLEEQARQAIAALPERVTPDQLTQAINAIRGTELPGERQAVFAPGEEWEQPGNIRYPGETPEEAIRREISEQVQPIEPTAKGVPTDADLLEARRQQIVQEMEKIAPEQPIPSPPAPGKTGEPIPVTPEVKVSEPWKSQVANEFMKGRAAAGEVGEIPPGKGFSTEEIINKGNKMTPEQVNRNVANVMKSGDPYAEGAALRKQEAWLSQRSQYLERLAAANPGDAEARANAQDALNDLTDFHNGPYAKAKQKFHAYGQSMQGKHDIDLGTYSGQMENWIRNNTNRKTGKSPEPPEAAKGVMRASADQLRKAQNAETDVLNRMEQAADKVIAQRKTKLPTVEDIQKRMAEVLKVEPCIAP